MPRQRFIKPVCLLHISEHFRRKPQRLFNESDFGYASFKPSKNWITCRSSSNGMPHAKLLDIVAGFLVLLLLGQGFLGHLARRVDSHSAGTGMFRADTCIL